MVLSHDYFPGIKGHTPTHVIPSELLQTIVPLKRDDYLKLLQTKPVKEWETLTEFLVKRHLLLLPSGSMLESSAAKLPAHAEREAAAKAARIASDEAAKQAAVKKAAAKKIRHETLMSQQKDAALKRAAIRKEEHAKRTQAVQERVTKAPTRELTTLKKAADVKRWLDAKREAALAQAKDGLSLRLALDRLPPVAFNRVHERLLRPVIPYAPPSGTSATRPDTDAFRSFQMDVIAAERHLGYLLFEGEAGWHKVDHRRRRKANTTVPSAST